MHRARSVSKKPLLHTKMPSLGMGAEEGSKEAIEADLNAGVLCDIWFLDGDSAGAHSTSCKIM